MNKCMHTKTTCEGECPIYKQLYDSSDDVIDDGSGNLIFGFNTKGLFCDDKDTRAFIEGLRHIKNSSKKKEA